MIGCTPCSSLLPPVNTCQGLSHWSLTIGLSVLFLHFYIMDILLESAPPDGTSTMIQCWLLTQFLFINANLKINYPLLILLLYDMWLISLLSSVCKLISMPMNIQWLVWECMLGGNLNKKSEKRVLNTHISPISLPSPLSVPVSHHTSTITSRSIFVGMTHFPFDTIYFIICNLTR